MKGRFRFTSLNPFSMNHCTSGFIAWLFGVTGPFLIILQSAAQGQLQPEATSSWVFAVYATGGALTIMLSVLYKQPIAVAFSIPGAVLVGTSLSNHLQRRHRGLCADGAADSPAWHGRPGGEADEIDSAADYDGDGFGCLTPLRVQCRDLAERRSVAERLDAAYVSGFVLFHPVGQTDSSHSGGHRRFRRLAHFFSGGVPQERSYSG